MTAVRQSQSLEAIPSLMGVYCVRLRARSKCGDPARERKGPCVVCRLEPTNVIDVEWTGGTVTSIPRQTLPSRNRVAKKPDPPAALSRLMSTKANATSRGLAPPTSLTATSARCRMLLLKVYDISEHSAGWRWGGGEGGDYSSANGCSWVSSEKEARS